MIKKTRMPIPELSRERTVIDHGLPEPVSFASFLQGDEGAVPPKGERP